MRIRPIASLFLILAAAILPATALDVDATKIKTRVVEFPSVPVAELDFAGLHAEVAFGSLQLGDPDLRTTRSICVPEQSENRLKDAIELPTHYYEVPYRTGPGVMVVRDTAGAVVYAERIDALESSENYGYDSCRYVGTRYLGEDYDRDVVSFREQIDTAVQGYFERETGAIMDEVLFFTVRKQKVRVYSFRDKSRDYTDLNEAAGQAETAYRALADAPVGATAAGRSGLERAVEIWSQALEESDLNNKKARINRKITVKLHESIGVASMFLGQSGRALEHLERASRLATLSTSRSDGTGTEDLLARARRRVNRSRRNPDLVAAPERVPALMQATEPFRGRIPIGALGPLGMARLEVEHGVFATGELIETVEAEADRREEAVASGRENPYERKVAQSTSQGFFLFLMPFSRKLDAFPGQVCELTHLNRLRMPGHGFEEVPETVGDLEALEVLDLSRNAIRVLPASIGDLGKLRKLDLSNNRIESMPDSIGGLKSLRSLQLKGNPLAPGELERLRRLLPKCKIKT